MSLPDPPEAKVSVLPPLAGDYALRVPSTFVILTSPRVFGAPVQIISSPASPKSLSFPLPPAILSSPSKP